MVKCAICGKVVKKCDKCDKLITEETNIMQFNDGKQHSCLKCYDKWQKLGLFYKNKNIHETIDKWFKEKYVDPFIFR